MANACIIRSFSEAKKYITLAGFCISLLHSSFGYPVGAPASACETMGPSGHGGLDKSVTTPYTISLSSRNYNCGESLLVTLQGHLGFFRGFLCQARRYPDDYTSTVGTLAQFGTRVVMNQNCGAGRALTHSEKGDKNIAEFTWTPFDDYGLVFFACTIVQSKNIYVVRKIAATIKYSRTGSCLKIPTTNLQTKFGISSAAASSSVFTTDSPKSSTYMTVSTKSKTSSASAYTANSTKSETLSTSLYSTDQTKSETPYASGYTTDLRIENQTNMSSSRMLLTSNPSASFYLFSNSSIIQSMSTLGTVGGLSSMSPKTNKNLCRNSAEHIRTHELLMLYSYYFLL